MLLQHALSYSKVVISIIGLEEVISQFRKMPEFPILAARIIANASQTHIRLSAFHVTKNQNLWLKCIQTSSKVIRFNFHEVQQNSKTTTLKRDTFNDFWTMNVNPRIYLVACVGIGFAAAQPDGISVSNLEITISPKSMLCKPIVYTNHKLAAYIHQ